MFWFTPELAKERMRDRLREAEALRAARAAKEAKRGAGAPRVPPAGGTRLAFRRCRERAQDDRRVA